MGRGGARIWTGSGLLQRSQLLFGIVGPILRIFAERCHYFSERRIVATFGGDAGHLDHYGKIAGLRRQNSSHQRLRFSLTWGLALSLDLLGETENGFQVFAVQFDGFFQMGDCFGQSAALAFDLAEQ